MLWSLIGGAVIGYLVLMFILHKMFEKIFMMLLFVISALFVFGLLYFVLRGAA